jgi:site-specific DNA-methyltransferase (adenine-specific)/modification methylase
VTAIKREERIGGQRLILGDCREIIGGLTFDAICADPPYGIEFSRGQGGGGFGGSKRYETAPDRLPVIKGDDEPFDPAFLLGLGLPTILWGANHYADKLPTSAKWLIWDKRRGTAVNDFADCEMAWTNLSGPARVLPHMWNGGLRDSEQGIPRFHKTQKAIVVMEWCLGFLPDAQTILDPFMGSGTTLVACQKLGRQGIGIELDPDYFEIACRRVDEATRQPDMFIQQPPKPVQEGMDL